MKPNQCLKTERFVLGLPRPRDVSSFTLTELLVVIGIIALLAALFLGVLPFAMRKARNIECASNLRQHGMAIMTFLGDHDAYPSEMNNNQAYGEGTLENALESGLGRDPRPLSRGNEKANSARTCPAGLHQRLPANYPSDRGIPGATYAYNDYGLGLIEPGRPPLGLGGTRLKSRKKGLGFVTAPPVAESAVISPSQMICMGDDIAGRNGVFEDATFRIGRRPVTDLYGATERARRRHGGKLNILFCDGHVEALKLGLLFSDKSDQALSMWSRDHRPHSERLK